MRMRSLVWKEMWQRPAPAVTALLAVALGVSALVAVQSIATSSEQKVASQMQQLGANILVLPAQASLQNYYQADLHGHTLPEEYVNRIVLAQKVGVEELAPKLCLTVPHGEQTLTITGVLPRTEFYKKSSWQSVDLLMDGLAAVEDSAAPAAPGQRHAGCNGRVCQISTAEMEDLHAYSKTRVIHDLGYYQILVGAQVAQQLNLQEGGELELFGEPFEIAAVLPPSGTVDDERVFAHLHTVQDLAETGPVVNVIEVMGCCEEVASGLVTELETLLPEAKVITISQLVETQITMNRLMGRMSFVLFAILMLIGGSSIASVMFANVSERRRELGTLMALGATPGMLSRLILMKASVIGLVGGGVGLLLGSILAWSLGPWMLESPVQLSLLAAGYGMLAALIVSLLASYWPAHRAGHLDPCVCFQDH